MGLRDYKFTSRLFKNSAAISAALFFFLCVHLVSAAMSSGNYKIPSDAISVGGQSSNSGAYSITDVVGENATGDSNSSNYKVSAGFLATQSVYISITPGGSVSMSPSISGISGGTGDGSVSWTVTTDDPAGYSLTTRSTTAPALHSSTSSFADYTLAGSVPDYNWSVASTDSEFGFTPEGVDIISRYKDNGSACNTGALDTADHCWDTFDTIGKTIAQRSSGNHPLGTSTTLKVRAEVGANHLQPNGNYSATVEVTALPL